MNGVNEAVPLTTDHSTKTDSERRRIRLEHPDVQDILTERWDEVEYAWLLKGRARFTRSVTE